MEGYQKMKRQLLPLIKGAPIVAGIFMTALFIARSIVKYTPNVYQTMAKIKLDDQKFGIGNNYMYKDFEMFSVENKIDAEAELLKSPLIIGMALDSLGFNVQFSRIGQMKSIVLYEDSPFKASCMFDSPEEETQTLHVDVTSKNNFVISYPETPWKRKGTFGKPVRIKGGSITLFRNEAAILMRKLDVIGKYEVKTYSKDELIKYVTTNLDVTALDKETPILRVVYKDFNAKKAADFVNMLCHTYIQDYITTKSAAAKQTVDFIENKLLTITRDLSNSESSLESFKKDNGVVNTLQETETGLREISKLKVELINMEMNEKAMRQLEEYIKKGNYFDETAINFGFGDLLMTELVKKLKVLYDERYDMTLKYTENSENVRAIDKKIAEIKKYIKEAIYQNLREIEIKRKDYERVVEEESHMFDNLPTREKEQHILERNFRINEDVYNFLTQKKIDASILASSGVAFHRIIQPAIVSKDPVSPNKTLLTFVFGLFGLIIGIGFIYFRQFTRARVLSRSDVEKNTTVPFLGVVRQGKFPGDFHTLTKSIALKKTGSGICITVNSTLSEEGKSHVSQGLAEAYAAQGKNVCLVDYSSAGFKNRTYTASLEEVKPDYVPTQNLTVLATLEEAAPNPETIAELKAIFDTIILDTSATANEINGIEAMKCADVTLFVVRANHTCINYLSEPDMIREEHGIEHMFIIMNGAHKATNYTGQYIGSRFDSKRKKTGILGKIRYYYQTYLR